MPIYLYMIVYCTFRVLENCRQQAFPLLFIPFQLSLKTDCSYFTWSLNQWNCAQFTNLRPDLRVLKNQVRKQWRLVLQFKPYCICIKDFLSNLKVYRHSPQTWLHCNFNQSTEVLVFWIRHWTVDQYGSRLGSLLRYWPPSERHWIRIATLYPGDYEFL